jgi:hypothetical protein
MKVEIVLRTGEKIVLIEESVCYIKRSGISDAEIHLANGEVLISSSPNFEAWRNDCFLEQ